MKFNKFINNNENYRYLFALMIILWKRTQLVGCCCICVVCTKNKSRAVKKAHRCKYANYLSILNYHSKNSFVENILHRNIRWIWQNEQRKNECLKWNCSFVVKRNMDLVAILTWWNATFISNAYVNGIYSKYNWNRKTFVFFFYLLKFYRFH